MKRWCAAVGLAGLLAAGVVVVRPMLMDLAACASLTPDDTFLWWWFGCGKDSAGGGGSGAA